LARPHALIAALKELQALSPAFSNIRIDESWSSGHEGSEVLQEEDVPDSIATVSNNFDFTHADASAVLTEQLPDLPVFQLERAEGKPVNFFEDPLAEALSFPWIFAEGKGGLHEDRAVPLSIKKYAIARIRMASSRDRMFSHGDHSYLFALMNSTESKQVACYCLLS